MKLKFNPLVDSINMAVALISTNKISNPFDENFGVCAILSVLSSDNNLGVQITLSTVPGDYH